MKIVNVTGKRKKAIARAVLSPGTGIIRINKVPIDALNNWMARMKLQEPLELAADYINDVDINVSVSGGGVLSQAEAARLAIAKGLVSYTKSEKLKETFLNYDRTLLVADVRQREARKPNTHGNARSKRQKSYR